MKNLKEILVSALALMLIAGVVTAALAGTNALTEDTIAAQVEATENAARKDVIEADVFRKSEVSVGGETVRYYTAYTNDIAVGYVFTTESVGKSAGLTVMTGISKAGTITGVKVTDDNETAGYVDKVVKAGFLAGLVGKPAQEMKVGTDVDAVSQATKTCGGICKAVNQAIAVYQAIKEGGADGK